MTTTAPHLTYRPVIDGLRAIAVLAVVAYHFGLPLPGGFTGVDVFFVLSGYLIGGLLWQELGTTGRLRLGRFWLRRIRRLAPAFFTMLAATALAGWFVLLPYDFREFGKEAISATLWLSNVYFWRGAGYFDGASEDKPLLHTWSLSVEEQFYIVLPLLFLALARWRGHLPAVLAALWALSLAACIGLTATQPTATFYLFPFRAWELLTGVLAAILLRDRRLPGWVALAGLALILAGLVLIRAGGGFPGWQAMIPVAGTALVLVARDEGPVARLLSHPLPVFVGLISYSLYLWHWPVMVLSRYWRDGWSGWPEAAGWLALALALSVASWALVERPVRRAATLGPRLLAGGFAAAVAVSLAFGLVLWRGDGLVGRFGPEARVQIAASQDFLQDWSRCTTPADGPFAGVETCAIGPDGPPRVVIWGDSHLRALMDGLAVAADSAGVPGVILWHAGCPPLTGITKTETAATPAQDAACTAATARTLSGIAELRPAAVLMVGRWAYYASGSGIGLDAQNLITLAPDGVTGDSQTALYAAAWQETVARLARATPEIFVFRQVPELPDHDSRALARALAHHRIDAAGAIAAGTVAPATLAPRSAAEAAIAALAATGALTLIDPWPMICTPDCTAVHDGQGWYFDNNHLTNAGAIALAPLFAPVFAAAGPAP
jgi:peptidoglycan/LPS O-acetylase OafA/YrhL